MAQAADVSQNLPHVLQMVFFSKQQMLKMIVAVAAAALAIVVAVVAAAVAIAAALLLALFTLDLSNVPFHSP